ncbi:MAG: dephospho-CoA kinase [Thermoanaerobaculaceae bacterium]
MLKVGLTGGVASGKSAVAELLAARGAAVRDADALVAELYETGTSCTQAIAGRFGPGVLASDGSIDRRALGAVVLADAEARRWLESVVHPAVRSVIATWLEGLRSTHPATEVAVVEAALLVETGSWREYDRLVVVSAPLELRRQRATDAGWESEAFERVLAAQLGDVEREAVADYVLLNRGSRAELAAAVGRLWSWLVEDAAGVGPRLAPRRPALRLG